MIEFEVVESMPGRAVGKWGPVIDALSRGDVIRLLRADLGTSAASNIQNHAKAHGFKVRTHSDGDYIYITKVGDR